jgi:hypothetical protein
LPEKFAVTITTPVVVPSVKLVEATPVESVTEVVGLTVPEPFTVHVTVTPLAGAFVAPFETRTRRGLGRVVPGVLIC